MVFLNDLLRHADFKLFAIVVLFGFVPPTDSSAFLRLLPTYAFPSQPLAPLEKGFVALCGLTDW